MKVSVVPGEGEGARVSANTACTLSHPGVGLLGLQGGESRVLVLSVGPFTPPTCVPCSSQGGPGQPQVLPENATNTLAALPGTPHQASVLPQPQSSQHSSSTTALWLRWDLPPPTSPSQSSTG